MRILPTSKYVFFYFHAWFVVFNVVFVLGSKKSHPISWSNEEVHIWLRSSGLEHCIPSFIKNNLYGEELLKLTRNRIREELGIIRFIHQSEILISIGLLIKEASKYLPNTEEIKELSKFNEWKTEEIIKWFEKINCLNPSLKESIKQLNITGKNILSYSIDDFCYIGLSPSKLKKFIKEKRLLQTSLSFDLITNYIQKINEKKQNPSNPTLYDESVDNWLQELRLVSSPLKKSPRIDKNFYDQIFIKEDMIYGFLNRKKGTGKWRANFFVLNFNAGSLTEISKDLISISNLTDPNFDYKSILSLKPMSQVILSEYTVRNIRFLIGRPNCFSISKKSKSHILYETTSQEISDVWVEHIRVSSFFFFYT